MEGQAPPLRPISRRGAFLWTRCGICGTIPIKERRLPLTRCGICGTIPIKEKENPGWNGINRRLEAFFARKDAEGVTNREKIAQNQRVIRRVATTDKTQSYEDAENPAAAGAYPAGVVLQDGKLIGFGIHIFNEDIYPLQSFEIYFRNCALGGALDLSGCSDLLFVDLYHNEIEEIDVSGDSALRILGLQDNAISALDVRDLKPARESTRGRTGSPRWMCHRMRSWWSCTSTTTISPASS